MGAHLKGLLAQQKLIRVFALGQLCHPKLVEMTAWSGGFDAVWLDQEHVGLTIGQIEETARAARASGIDSFVRLNATDYATVMRALEAGAGGVMASMVRSARQAADILNWAKFAPRGGRGVNGTGVDGRYGTTLGPEYFRRANAESVVGIQIEHIDAVNEVEQIAALSDLDFLFIGPADLSQSLGLAGQWDHPEVWGCIERVAQVAKDHRVPWGILPLTPAFGRRCVDLGCRMLSLGIDVWFYNKGLAAFKQEYAEFF
jgi:2-dehydro-3-deoxyglucarate aldolase/4-hydroxy-2-oxoheptanedioate aldolase